MRKAAALILATVGGGVLVPGCAGSEPVRPWLIDEAEVVFTARRDSRSPEDEREPDFMPVSRPRQPDL